jgi:hypothetical protein
MSNWIHEAEAALSGKRTTPEGDTEVEVVENHAPPLLDVAFGRALLAPFLAGFMWAAVIFRETQAQSSLDPLALLLRVLALALSVRALRVLWALAVRLRLWLRWKRHALVLTDEGLLYRTPETDVVVPKRDVLDIREQGATALSARSGTRWADAFVITQPDSGRAYVALPPIFRRSPRALSELLMRWRGAPESAPQLPAASPESLPSRLWERAAAGESLSGVVAVAHGYAWLKRGPYASMLLGLAVLDGFVRLPAAAQRAVNPLPALLLAGALVIVPAAWVLFTRASLSAQRGLSLVLAPTELLTRTRGGIVRVPWSSVARVEVQARTSWSLLQGAYEARNLILHRKREQSVICPEAYLAVPIEVVAGLCDAYRKHAQTDQEEALTDA